MYNAINSTVQKCLHYCFLIGTILYAGIARAQQPDTLYFTLPELESSFLAKNLSLAAAKYNVEINKALELQAGVWDNPVIETDQNIYANKRWFEHGKDINGNPTGQYFIQIQQLIKTAGKRSKLVALAASSTKISALQFGELMRTLKYQLRSDYYQNGILLSQRQLLNEQLQTLLQLQKGMEAQLNLGNIASKEYLRVQSLVVALQQDLADNQRILWDIQTELKTLLQITGNVFIKTSPPEIRLSTDSLNVDKILDLARKNNTAYLIQQETLNYQQRNLVYQQALRVPDITLAPSYDHNSNYIPHYFGLGVSLPLPLFNKNKGNIKAAGLTVKQQEITVQQSGDQLVNDVQNALQKLYTVAGTQSTGNTNFYTAYRQLMEKMAQSYQQRQIGLVEFADFFDNYRSIINKNNEQQLNYLLSIEELNYQAGTDIIHP